MKYYKVVVTRGHMGAYYQHATMTFYERAENMMSAIDMARKHGGVKHNRLPCQATEITADEYYANRGTNAYERAYCKPTKVFSFLRLFRGNK